VALTAPRSQAENWLSGDLGEPWDLSTETLGEESPVDIGGWTQWGYHNRSNGLFNSHPDRFNNHQTYFYIERAADGSEGLDFGGRFDIVYGVDAQDTQAFGNNPGKWDFQKSDFNHGIYGWAIPQAYLEAACGDLSVKVGHFYTLIGYEVVTAPDNFFYSHAFTQYLSEPFTHTGALASYTVNENVTAHLGWVAGWDTGFDQFNGGSAIHTGAIFSLGEDATFSYMTTFGNLGWVGDGYSHSLVLNLSVTDELNYIVQSDLLHTEQSNFDPTGTTTNAIGLNQYLIYAISDRIGVGGRAEWWKADGVSYYELTGGVNIRPCANFVVRPEVRYQWSPSGDEFSGISNNANPAGLPLDEGAIFGVDAILTF
jgi:hypothetical protein